MLIDNTKNIKEKERKRIILLIKLTKYNQKQLLCLPQSSCTKVLHYHQKKDNAKQLVKQLKQLKP